MTTPQFDAGEKVTKLSLEGRLDAAAFTAIQFDLMAKTTALKKPVFADMSCVTFMASPCIRMLVAGIFHIEETARESLSLS